MGAPNPQHFKYSDIKDKILHLAQTSVYMVDVSSGLTQDLRSFMSKRQLTLNSNESLSLRLLCCDASLPGSGMATHEVTGDFHGVTEKMAYRRIYDDTIETQRVQRNNLLYINKSPLTKPTKKYPLYIYEEEKLYVYPNTITPPDKVSASFVRKPKDVIWNFTATAPFYTYSYSPNTSQQFELMISEQTNVITKILLYSGVVIKDPQIIQVAAQQIQNENINSKS